MRSTAAKIPARLTSPRTYLDPVQFVGSSLPVLRTLPQARDRAIDFAPPRSACVVYADPDALSSALVEAVAAECASSASGARISIAVEVDAWRVWIRVGTRAASSLPVAVR
jgi:hypothetical protein